MTQIANIWNVVSSVVKDYVESEKKNFENLGFWKPVEIPSNISKDCVTGDGLSILYNDAITPPQPPNFKFEHLDYNSCIKEKMKLL